jgi:uncharacterized membrane protein
MRASTLFGRLAYAASIIVFGVQYLIYARGMAGPVVGPPWITGRTMWAYLVGLGCIAAGVSIAANLKGRDTSILLTIALALIALLVYLPRLMANIHNPGPWTSGFEVLALCGGALVISGTLSARTPWPREQGGSGAIAMGKYLFAMTLIVFGVQHFLYARFVATLITPWIPGHLFWAYFVGVAFIATTLALVTGKQAFLAANLLGIMFLLWFIVLHMPRVFASPRNGNELTSAFIALAMCGSSFVIAGSLTGRD